MSKIMEDLSVHDSRFNFVTEEIDKPEVAEMTKGKSRMRGRKALANISNMGLGFTATNQVHKSGPSSDDLRKHIEQLQKEKTALMKHLEDKNKVIKLGGIEMQRLRVTLEKMKQQNSQLAQSNSQIQAEVNSVKERLKVLNHELGCKNGLIIAKNLELEHNTVTEPEEKEVCKVAEFDDGNQTSKSSVHSNKKVEDNDKGKSRRLQTRRQSAKFKLDEPKPTQDSLKMNIIDDISLRILPDYNAAAAAAAAVADDEDDDDDDGGGGGGGGDILKVNDFNGGASSSKKEDTEEDSFQDDNKHQEHRKTLLLRPVREAAKKVQSYKEVNLVVKMRRE